MDILPKSAQKVYILRIYSIKHYFAQKRGSILWVSYGYVWGNIWRDIEDERVSG